MRWQVWRRVWKDSISPELDAAHDPQLQAIKTNPTAGV